MFLERRLEVLNIKSHDIILVFIRVGWCYSGKEEGWILRDSRICMPIAPTVKLWPKELTHGSSLSQLSLHIKEGSCLVTGCVVIWGWWQRLTEKNPIEQYIAILMIKSVILIFLDVNYLFDPQFMLQTILLLFLRFLNGDHCYLF